MVNQNKEMLILLGEYNIAQKQTTILFVNDKEGSFKDCISRIPWHGILLKDCSDVYDPSRTFLKEISRMNKCIVNVLISPTIVCPCTRWLQFPINSYLQRFFYQAIQVSLSCLCSCIIVHLSDNSDWFKIVMVMITLSLCQFMVHNKETSRQKKTIPTVQLVDTILLGCILYKQYKSHFK